MNSESKDTQIVSLKKLMEARVYFGHNKSQWNPKIKPYILKVNKGIHIIDLKKTLLYLDFAYKMVCRMAEKGADFIFVGTKHNSKQVVKENALRTNSHYVVERWLGGTLTNNRTIFKRVRRMKELQRLKENNFSGYTKKEGVLLNKELAKLEKNLSGIKDMRKKPAFMIMASPLHDIIALKEAKKVGMKIIGIVDTDTDPSLLDIAIPANDDSTKSVALIITVLADAISAAKNGEIRYAFKADEEIELPEEVKRERTNKSKFKNWSLRNYKYSHRKKTSHSKVKKEKDKEPKVNSEAEDKSQEKEKTISSKKVDYSSMKLVVLRELVKKRKITVKGRLKSDYIKALEEKDASKKHKE